MSSRAPLIHVTHPNVPDEDVQCFEEQPKEDAGNTSGVDNGVFIIERDVPTPLPLVKPNNSSMFVFEADCTSLYSRRGSNYSAVTSQYPSYSRRGSHGQTGSEKSSLTVPTSVNFRSSDSGWAGGNGLKSLQLDSVSETQIPPPSPGLLSTHSAWSELVRLGTSRKSSDAGLSDVSRSNSNSLSNVSSSLSDHLRYLVRAFSSRTERVKESTVQPPSPSSLSDYATSEALSAISTENPQIRHRLDAFFPDPPEGDTVSEIVRIQEELSAHSKYKFPRWLKRLCLPHVLEPQSKLYLFWLMVVTLAFMYNAWVIPLRAAFPYQTPDNVKYWLLCDYICDFIYIIDIVLFKTRITYLNSGLKETSRRNTRKNYFKKSIFKYDLLSLLPLDLLYLINMKVNPWCRLPRILKIQTFWEFYSRCDHMVRSAHAVRIVKTMTYMLFLIHVETCGYYAVSVYEGINTNKWVYNGKGNAYIRCFYLATKTATSIGNNPKPTNVLEYSFMTVYWVSGVFVFALLIGQIRDIVDAANLVKTVYTQRMDAALQYVKNMNLPKDTQDRVRTWFIYNWQQQKIIDERNLMDALPNKLRTDLAIHVHFNTLSKVKLFQDCDKTLLYDLVLKLKPILYLPGDYVCKKGEIGREMYIVSQGIVEVVGGPDNLLVLATLKEGSVFGEISLLAMAAEGNRRTADVRCRGFTNLFILSKADFEAAMTDYPDAHQLLKKRAKKLLRVNARLQKKSVGSMDQSRIKVEGIIKTPPETPKLVRTVLQVMDPESNLVRHLSNRSLCSNDGAESHDGQDGHPGKHNEGFEFGSDQNLMTKPQTVEEVEEFYDEMLKREDWACTLPGEVEISKTDGRTNSVQKKTSNSSESSCDSGVQDTKNASPSSSTTRTFSNKDSKESFISTELGNILEDSEDNGAHHSDTSDENGGTGETILTFNHNLDMLEEIEREISLGKLKVEQAENNDEKGDDECDKGGDNDDDKGDKGDDKGDKGDDKGDKGDDKSDKGDDKSDKGDDKGDKGGNSNANSDKEDISKTDTRKADLDSDKTTEQTDTASKTVVSEGSKENPDKGPEKDKDHDSNGKKITVKTLQKHASDTTPDDNKNKRKIEHKKTKLEIGRERLKSGGSSKPNTLVPRKIKTATAKKHLPETGKPKLPPKPDMTKIMDALGRKPSGENKPKENNRPKSIKFTDTNITSFKEHTKARAGEAGSSDRGTKEQISNQTKHKTVKSEILNVSNLPVITMERPSDDDNSSENTQSPQMGQSFYGHPGVGMQWWLGQQSRNNSNTNGNIEIKREENPDNTTTDKNKSRIPPENQVTCMVEIHREKSLTPSPSDEKGATGRRRKISVCSKDEETAL